MPWQPFTPESGQRKALRDDSPDSLASLAGRTDHYRRRPSHLEEFVIQVRWSVLAARISMDFVAE